MYILLLNNSFNPDFDNRKFIIVEEIGPQLHVRKGTLKTYHSQKKTL